MVAVGIDVSKKDLDIELIKEGGSSTRFRVSNKPDGFESLVRRAESFARGEELHFCLESTGGYEFDLACFLCSGGFRVSVENPARIKYFGVAMGYKNKTDKADARTIAQYCLMRKPSVWAMGSAAWRELAQLLRHRASLLEEFDRIQNWLEHQANRPEMVVRHNKDLSARLCELLAEAEADLERRVREDAAMSRMVGALLKIDGVGPVLASTLIVELGDVTQYESAQHYASAAGLNPCKRESGTSKGKSRISKAGNKWVRKAAHMPAVKARTTNEQVKRLCERLEERKLLPKQIIAAAARKLVMICYGVLKAIALGREPFYGSLTEQEQTKLCRPAKLTFKFRPSTRRQKLQTKMKREKAAKVAKPPRPSRKILKSAA